MNREKGMLEKRLTRRVVVVQIATVALLFIIVVFPPVIFLISSSLDETPRLDPRASSTIGQAIRLSETGDLLLASSNALVDLKTGYPELWFFVVSADNGSLTYGSVPDAYQNVEPYLSAIQTLDLRLDGDGASDTMAVYSVESPIGTVKIMMGNSPTLPTSEWVPPLVAVCAIAILLATTGSSLLLLPRIIRRELRGISDAEAAAELIDINGRGVRLPTQNIPAEIRSLVAAVNDGLSRLDDAAERRERFLADSAHELRTPITVLQTRLELTQWFPDKSRLLLDVRRLATLADQLLDLQRRDNETIEHERLNLREVAADVVAHLAPLAITNDCELSLEAPDESVWVVGDGPSIGRALGNLIQNAMVHGRSGGLIQVIVGSEGTVSVLDEGRGVPVEEQSKIFEPFYRLHPERQGTGLGLNLVEQVVHEHGGSVTTTNRPEGGANFTITLPTVS